MKLKVRFEKQDMQKFGLYALLSIVVLAVCLIAGVPMIYGVGVSIVILIIHQRLSGLPKMHINMDLY